MQRTEGFVMLSLVLGQADLWWMVGLLFNSHMQLRLAEPGQLALAKDLSRVLFAADLMDLPVLPTMIAVHPGLSLPYSGATFPTPHQVMHFALLLTFA